MRRKLSRSIPKTTSTFARRLIAPVVLCVSVIAPSVHAAPSNQRRGSDSQTPTDSDLMLKALTAERGETPNAARIERAAARARVDSMRRRATTVVTVWKDPFAEDPERPVEVRMPASKKPQSRDEVTAMRRELARARAETAAAQASAAAAQAEAARAKANSARAEAEAARVQAVAARHEAAAARAECVATTTEKAKRPSRARVPDGNDGLGRFAVPRGERAEPPAPRLAAKARTPARSSAMRRAPSSGFTEAMTTEAEPPPPPLDIEATHAAVAPSGIIVVPITR